MISTTPRIQSGLLRLAMRALPTLAAMASLHPSLGAGPVGPSAAHFPGWLDILSRAALSFWNALLHILFWRGLLSPPGQVRGSPHLGHLPWVPQGWLIPWLGSAGVSRGLSQSWGPPGSFLSPSPDFDESGPWSSLWPSPLDEVQM